jgi:hypothetical protein
MDIKNYKKKTNNVYTNLYKNKYLYHPVLINIFSQMLKKNFKDLKIDYKEIKNLKVLNVGTGLEAVTMHKLGFKKIFHFDLNKKSSLNLKKYIKINKINNMFSKNIDVCEKIINIEEGVDLIYLQGVTHHFLKMKKGINNILNNLNINGSFFIRNYRSGSLNYFIADFVRKFIQYNTIKYFNEVFYKKFKLFKYEDHKNEKSWKDHLYMLCFDNFYVPKLHLIETKKLNTYFKSGGFKQINKNNMRVYDHNNFKPSNTLNNFIFKKVSKKKFLDKNNTFKHCDQLNDINYNEKYIKDTVSFFKKNLNKIKKLNTNKKILLAIELFEIADFNRFHLNIHNKKNKLNMFNTAEKVHLGFLNKIKEFI